MSAHQPQTVTGSSCGAIGMQQPGPGPPPGGGQNMPQQNLNQIVLEYLDKKGYKHTEQVLRQESANVDHEGRPIHDGVEDLGNAKYAKALNLLNNWIKSNMEVYMAELKRVPWPLFLYSFLELIKGGSAADAHKLLAEFGPRFKYNHGDDLKLFATISLSKHADENETTRTYLENKYVIPLSDDGYLHLNTFLQSNFKAGGSEIAYLLSTYCTVNKTKTGPLNQFSFEAILNQARNVQNDPALREGIPGAFTGVSHQDIADNNAILKLGMMPIEPELAEDVRAELEEEDAKNPPQPNQSSLVEEFDHLVKREESADAPTRAELPLPASRARDVILEVQKIKEHRDRFKIESRTGGVGPAVSVCMFTFHNTMSSVSVIEFSDDNNLVAVGTQESYIRVWHMHGDVLPSIVKPNPRDPPATSSRRLYGHSQPVYGLSFSPSIDNIDEANNDKVPSTAPKQLLSASSDGTVRLWSLESWSCLVIFKGHDGPVWYSTFGPFGHYFASCGRDKRVRVWAQDHVSYLRMMIGHDSSVSHIAWHPNGVYVFSVSDGVDKTIRMWSVVTGGCVRIFSGHTHTVSSLECSRNGKILASADSNGIIMLWDIAKGSLIKRCKGHGKLPIWSLSFSVESTVLVSGGADGTVRLWDVELPAHPHQQTDGEVVARAGQVDATRIDASASGTSASQPGTSAGGKKKGKDVTVTPDQINAFPTKSTPVLKVKFTRMNLIVAVGYYDG